MANTTPTPEVDARVEAFNSFMSCPHRDTDEIKKVHMALRHKDPLFYPRLACWYMKNGDIRDHKEVFASMLITDPYLENREVGLAMFRQHAPFMKGRILGFVKGKKVKIRKKVPGQKIKVGKKMIDKTQIEIKSVGLGVNVPTAFKKDIEKYLRWLESDNDRFDSVALRNAKDLKSLYASKGCRIKPSARAQQILFEKNYPEDSKLNVFKKIATASPEAAAKLIVENKLPYTVAVGLVDKVTPTILIALINAMTPQEVINNIASLQEKGVYDNEDTKKLIQAKLEKAKTSKKVSALKSKTAKDTGRVKNVELQKQLDDIADIQVKKSGVIKVPTAVFVDRSGSMSQAIEVGKRVAALISGVTEAPLYVVAFDNAPTEITSQGPHLSDWEKAFRPIRSGGSTSMGCALDYLLRTNKFVEQIVVITDEGENATPLFTSVYAEYAKKKGVTPHVVVINVADNNRGVWRTDRTFSNNLKSAKIDFDMYKPDGNDYYGLPGLVTLLSRKSRLDLIYEIMATPLMTRNGFR